ncbi:hypothetical protein [Catellatospora citrea]|uniref:Uncharacterized protein n=1 Tax=Catellatospora citrea TaxID=53366 RepID=A0A8J3P1D3_9ACTN|nr:hypothetical protein [Catellatospora citrea]RKE06157.1 hypothetical protein C8E86_0976 [Catellatospora citrea]GIG00496.1 hypothetical protein Cci01nite_55890 [Catellatospora citrea]
MTRIRAVAQVAVPFVWFGMVAAISLLEAPLKFRAPGVTTALGLGIGRLVFQALNIAEFVLLVVLTAAVLGVAIGRWRWAVTGGLWALLLTQALVLRPLLDQRAQLIIDGGRPPESALHLAYIALEGIKLIALPVLGIGLLLRIMPRVGRSTPE